MPQSPGFTAQPHDSYTGNHLLVVVLVLGYLANRCGMKRAGRSMGHDLDVVDRPWAQNNPKWYSPKALVTLADA